MSTSTKMHTRLYNSLCKSNTKQLLVLYLALYVIALGTSGLKSSVSGFGSDQFDESNKEEKKDMNKFFSWFYFIVSIGSLLSVTILVCIYKKF